MGTASNSASGFSGERVSEAVQSDLPDRMRWQVPSREFGFLRKKAEFGVSENNPKKGHCRDFPPSVPPQLPTSLLNLKKENLIHSEVSIMSPKMFASVPQIKNI